MRPPDDNPSPQDPAEPDPTPRPTPALDHREAEERRLGSVPSLDAGATDPVQAELRRLSRRGFAAAGIAAAVGIAGWEWLVTRSSDQGLPWPFRRVLELNERLALGAFRPSRLSPSFPPARARQPRVNGVIGLTGPDGDLTVADHQGWRLRLERDGLGARHIGLDELKRLPRVEHTTELRCIEGWSTVVSWAGARLADLAAQAGAASRSGRPFDPAAPLPDLLSYVSLSTPDGSYYVGLDIESALHPQTLLCYEMNGAPLTTAHGAPLRLVIPVKYGIKNIKRIGTLRFTDTRPADYWCERGYDWYAGH